MQLNRAEAVKELTISVPKSSIISKSQSKILSAKSLPSTLSFFLNVLLAKISNNRMDETYINKYSEESNYEQLRNIYEACSNHNKHTGTLPG